MRLPTPRQQAAIVLAALLLPALTYVAWPLLPFLAGLLPEALPVGRILLGALLAAGLAATIALARSGTREKKPVWLGWLILAAWAVAIATVAGIVLLVWLVLGSPGLEDVGRLSPQNLDALATRAFAVVAGLGGVALLMIAYRRQRTTENGEQRETIKLFNERFTAAYTELGSEHAAVRLGAVHALAHLADDAPSEEEVQMVIDVLCAYLRMPYTTAPAPLPEDALPEQRAEHRSRELEFASFREVRHTVIRIIGNHLRKPTRWRGKNYDFTGTVFDGGNLTGAEFSGGTVDFTGARFTSGTLDFTGARFTEGTVDFRRARFTSGTVDFTGAEFSGGTVFFRGARFSGGRVDFEAARFTGGTVPFRGARFTGGTVFFRRARFTEGTVDFDAARFTEGTVSFEAARFSGGTVDFRGARFTGGRVDFDAAWFSGGTVFFRGARFTGGRVDFEAAQFTEGTVSFEAAQFTGGTVDFGRAAFTSGLVSFDSASGNRPDGLPTDADHEGSVVVNLPEPWR